MHPHLHSSNVSEITVKIQVMPLTGDKKKKQLFTLKKLSSPDSMVSIMISLIVIYDL